MKILFLMRNAGYIRNFDTALGATMDRGHTVSFALEIDRRTANEVPAYDRLERLVAERPTVATVEPTIAPDSDPNAVALEELRAVRDYLRYLEPSFRQSPDLRARAHRRIRSNWIRLVNWADKGGFRIALLDRVLSFLERGAPVDRALKEWLAKDPPDLICVTPLVALGSCQPEYLRAARELGIPSALCVASWDNLTNKGLVHGDPDGVLVWNAAQKAEAATLHGLPPFSVHVVGAHSYDHWFDWEPSRPRDEFLREAGLEPGQRTLLYLCSSPFIAPKEIDFLEGWLRAVREADDPILRDANVLIRPHPQNPQPWERLDRPEVGPLAVFPKQGDNPVGRPGRQLYFDSLHTADLVVGINTSALIEAGILGKAVYTVRHPDHSARQEGTVHFHLLQEVDGGLLTLAPDFATHLSDLSAGLADPAAGAAKAKRFVSAFVRPQGLADPSAPRFAEALEAIAAAGPRKVPDRFFSQIAWRLLSRALQWLSRRHKPVRKSGQPVDRTEYSDDGR